MSMNLEETTQKVVALAEKKGGSIGKKIKFKFDEGVILLDDSSSPTQVSNEDEYADCTVKLSLSNFNKLMNGEMNAMGAFMMGKIKVEGDMGIATKLSNLF
ncbi:SCP2 sterol-binding domain-containing protein [Reichenbachiella ulvae]|uniref:SCP2 sterol-binding domain-containing protein n=1 Tax=Reichenbachiella ulvae TaxID=2980104 RepID=A0ABT3CU60_9BACT|nr:SCP2 sterol-binding domain-containing protein [Reichenbachiella ulvae]MCV9386773.1 SCP2 sterol-binding domain-containing protein [Reichenbachiella ulvae]